MTALFAVGMTAPPSWLFAEYRPSMDVKKADKSAFSTGLCFSLFNK